MGWCTAQYRKRRRRRRRWWWWWWFQLSGDFLDRYFCDAFLALLGVL